MSAPKWNEINLVILITSHFQTHQTEWLFFSFFQIDREKADLSVQVISLSERLEEAEGGAESQVKWHFLGRQPDYFNYPFAFSLKSTASATLNWERCVSSLKTSTWSPKRPLTFWRRSTKKLLSISTNKSNLSQRLKIGKWSRKNRNLASMSERRLKLPKKNKLLPRFHQLVSIIKGT